MRLGLDKDIVDSELGVYIVEKSLDHRVADRFLSPSCGETSEEIGPLRRGWLLLIDNFSKKLGAHRVRWRNRLSMQAAPGPYGPWLQTMITG